MMLSGLSIEGEMDDKGEYIKPGPEAQTDCDYTLSISSSGWHERRSWTRQSE